MRGLSWFVSLKMLELEDKKSPGVPVFINIGAPCATKISLLVAEGDPPLCEVVGRHF